MKKLYKSLVAILIAMVLATVLSASASAADVGRVTGLKASAVTNNSVALVWNKIAAADGYRIQYRENNGTWITISDTLQTNAYVVKNLKVGSTYSFRVNAYDIVEVKIPILGTVISSEKDHANYSTVVSVSNSIGKVTDLKATTAAPTKVKLTWSKVNGADGYLIQKKVGDTWKNVKSVTTLSYTVTGLKVGSTTSFRVKAYATVDGKKVYGSVSSTVKGTAKVPNMSGFAVKVKDTSSVTLSWTKKSSVTGYQIYRKAGSGDWKKIKTISKNSTVTFTNTGLTLGTKYQYKVRAYYKTDSKTYYGAYTSVKSVTPTLPAVIGVELNTFITKNKATITWDKVSGAKGYNVYDFSSGTGVKIASVTVNKATIAVEDNKVYSLKVRAYTTSSGATINGVYSDVYELYTTPAAVKNLSYEALPDNSVKLYWDDVTTAHGYKVEVINNSTAKWELYTICADNFHIISDSSRLPGTNFRVSAFVRNNGISLYGGNSNVITAKFIQRPDLFVGDSTSSYISLIWTPINEATTYILEKYNFNEDKWDVLKETYETQYNDKVPETSYAMGGLYRVYAKTYDGSRSSASDEIMAYSEGVSVTQDGAAQTISWPAVENAAKYRIYVKNLYGDRSYLGSIIPATTNSATVTLTPDSLQAIVIHAYAANGDYIDCAVDELLIKTEPFKVLDKNHYHYNHSINSQILYLVDAINKTKHETSEVTVSSSSVVSYDTDKFFVNSTSFNGSNIEGLLKFINTLAGLSKNSADFEDLTLSGKETSSDTVTFENCIGKNAQGKSVYLATYIDPSDEDCAYLYAAEDPSAWKDGVKSITVTPINGGGYKVVLELYKEEYGSETNAVEAHYHKGFATTVASLGQFSTSNFENQLTSVGDTTITAVINANGTLDSYQVSSPYTMKMKSPVKGITGINSFGMQIKGNVSSVYTFSR